MADWLFDLGNSRLKYAPLLADGSIGDVAAIAHDGTRFDVQAWSALPVAIKGTVHLASVAAPALREGLEAALVARGGTVMRATTMARCDGVEIAYATPANLGVDRFLALLAAHGRGGRRLVVGVGTALTIDLIDADGLHQGGRIAPSPTLMRESLHARASQLPRAGGDYAALGRDTADALASGCIGAAVALVERSLQDADDGTGATSLLLHGGGAGELRPHLAAADWAPHLVLEGLARWAQAQRDR